MPSAMGSRPIRLLTSSKIRRTIAKPPGSPSAAADTRWACFFPYEKFRDAKYYRRPEGRKCFPRMKTALICGVSGQDGAYLAKLLLEKGYHVIGTSRDAQIANFANLDRLSIADHVERQSMVLTDFRSTLQTIAKAKPDEVYNLAGQSSVALSFQQPVETMDSISVGTLNLLEAVRFLGSEIRVYNASSSECFGDTEAEAASEQTPFRPRSPYAVAKGSRTLGGGQLSRCLRPVCCQWRPVQP